MKSLRKLLIVMLMLIVPVQGMAAAFAPVHKVFDAQAVAGMPCHDHHHAQQATHDAKQEGTTAPDHTSGGAPHDMDAAGHVCCHQVFSCTPTTTLVAGARKFSDVSYVVVPLYTLFIPDSPDRPPRG